MPPALVITCCVTSNTAKTILKVLLIIVTATKVLNTHLKNIHVSAKDESGKIIFLHKVKDGPVDKSYGINVAALAKLPKSLIARSKDILEKLETENHAHNVDLTLFNFEVSFPFSFSLRSGTLNTFA